MSLRVSCTRLTSIAKFCNRRKYLHCKVSSNRYLRSVMSSVDSFSTSSKRTNMNQERTVDIASNPFFEKYKAKIQHIQITNPKEYEEKLKELSERLNPKASPVQAQTTPDSDRSQNNAFKGPTPTVVSPSESAKAGVGMIRSKGLDSMVKLEVIKDRNTEEIIQIWNQYHSSKDCVYTVLHADEFKNMMDKARECPVFVYPIPRHDGFEFILAQFDQHDVYFTPLAMFQMVRENAPPCLTLTYYPELVEEKGIVLMSGQFDEKVLKQTLALSLVQQMSIFYGKGSKYYDIVHKFNYQPEQFQYQELIDTLKYLPQYDMK